MSGGSRSWVTGTIGPVLFTNPPAVAHDRTGEVWTFEDRTFLVKETAPPNGQFSVWYDDEYVLVDLLTCATRRVHEYELMSRGKREA